MPIPGTPTSVTSCGERSTRTRANAPSSSARSWSRPTSGEDDSSSSPPTRPRGSSASHTSTGSAFPFASIGAVGAEHDRALRRAVRRGRDEDPVDRRGRLDSRRGVHHVAGDHRLARLRPRVDRDERLAGRDADADVEVERLVALVQVGDRVAHGERRSDGPLGIVLVGRRGAVHGDDRVADELLDGAAVALERPAQRLVVAAQERPDVLGVELLRARRRADEVDEDRRDDLPLLARGR